MILCFIGTARISQGSDAGPAASMTSVSVASNSLKIVPAIPCLCLNPDIIPCVSCMADIEFPSFELHVPLDQRYLTNANQ